MLKLITLPPLSLYIHIPWCVQKCPYCDFFSLPSQGALPEQDYILALLADFKHDLPLVGTRPIQSIFIGGGTPSLLSPNAVNTLLSGLKRTDTAEITLEANPGTVDSTRFCGFRAAGINRLSLGIQSFNDDMLQRLGRIHGRIEAISAIKSAQNAGFNTLNLDLMFGLPGQTVAEALEDLRMAVSFQPSHLSWYQLTIEPNTPFYHNPPILPDDDILWEMHMRGQQYLQEQAYVQYEISAYAKSGQQCQHNLNYWKFGDYLGIGAGAHAKISYPDRITRRVKQDNPHSYLHAVITQSTTLTTEDVVLEFMINALRLVEGFTPKEFITYTGLSMSCITQTVQEACTRGWLQYDTQGIYVTPLGRRYLNDVLGLFVA